MRARRRVGWIVCLISALVPLGIAANSVKSAFYFRLPIGTGPGQRDPYWFLGKQMDLTVSPFIFCLAAVGCVVCWRRNTGKWLSIAALLVGIACWIAAVRTYP
jgi:hypothetical protein